LNKAAYTKTGLWSGDHYVLAAIWEGHNGREVAEFASRKCHETFSRCLAANGNLVDDALRKTFTDIDHSFFESQISAEVLLCPRSTSLARARVT
jgi:serine/threonine protein phosphatase PrpC